MAAKQRGMSKRGKWHHRSAVPIGFRNTAREPSRPMGGVPLARGKKPARGEGVDTSTPSLLSGGGWGGQERRSALYQVQVPVRAPRTGCLKSRSSPEANP
jgi:hypothetical protein